MEPNITLIWFVQPQWFQKMGAFARRENIPVFVEWCETAFKLFGELPHQHMYHHMLLTLADLVDDHSCDSHTAVPTRLVLFMRTWHFLTLLLINISQPADGRPLEQAVLKANVLNQSGLLHLLYDVPSDTGL